MHTEFDLNFLRVVLTIEKKPATDSQGHILTDAKGKVLFEPNPSKAPYVIYDTHRDAPKGLFVRVGPAGKTLYLQVRQDDRVVKAKLGDLRDFQTTKAIYAKGFEYIATIRSTGRNPNTIRRERAFEDSTLDEIFDEYVQELMQRAKPVAENTFIAIKKGRKKLECWKEKRVSELTSSEIISKFDELKKGYKTATEQAFRWASAATKRKIQNLQFEVRKQGAAPPLLVNPFDVLVNRKLYRSREQLEKEYKAKGVRNPLALENQLSIFLNLVWDRRAYRHTASDYILCELLWGCRKSEHRVLKWKECVPKGQEEQHSWVDLNSKVIYFHHTKNGRAHELPLAPMAENLLRKRQELRAIELENTVKGVRHQYVFPAQSKTSKSGYYSNPKDMLDSIGAQMEAKITPHDLRRTFGRVLEMLDMTSITTKRLLNHASGDVTMRYTEAEFERLRAHMTRVEQTILSKAPRIYNALRPLDTSPIPDVPWTTLPYRKDQRQKLEEQHAHL